ncbi:MAG: hypothetical protein LBC70_02295 [Chitinispirillales bacterium]|jgi:hypothetical protein|nr:hypothetical protein [Chitinispirillales bacterium]
MNRIEEFVRHGKKYIYFDLSDFRTNDEFRQLIELAKPAVMKYKKQTVYAITNVDGIRFDSETKRIVAEWMEHNAPYIKYSVITGMDGMKKLMLNSILAISGRYNVGIASTKEQAVELVKMRDWGKLDKWARV